MALPRKSFKEKQVLEEYTNDTNPLIPVLTGVGMRCPLLKNA